MNNTAMNFENEHLQFVTGRLAEKIVRSTVDQLAQKLRFDYSVTVLPITVAALMTPKWLLKNLVPESNATRVIIPGHLDRHVDEIQAQIRLPIACGPRDIRDLPRFFGHQGTAREGYGAYSTEIIAEINHADRYELEQLVETALALKSDGADVIDLGCTPGQRWSRVAEAVQEIIARDIAVSIDSFDPWEVAAATEAGASLVLSVNSRNRSEAAQWGCEVVAIPDTPDDEKSLEETVEFLDGHQIPCRIDPILEPIGCGFAESLQRYARFRKRFPEHAMMMGIGNLTELTDADSAAINVMLLGICEELGVGSVLTTQVINWARTSVRECDLARRLVHFACQQGTPPKRIESQLVMLRDEKPIDFDTDDLEALAATVKDRNIRIYTVGNQIHLVSADTHVWNEDPFLAMQALLDSEVGQTIDPSHAFYLGYELAKARTAITLSKRYTQDEALDWGYLTTQEKHHRLPRTKAQPKSEATDE